MGVKTIKAQKSLFEAGTFFGELLNQEAGSERFRFFHKQVWPELVKREAELKELYCLDNGRPGESPVRLLGVSILQFMEKLPDRQAVEALTFDLRWKCALGMEADEGGFHPTVLVRFRERLLKAGKEQIGFEAALEALRGAGYLGKKTAQRLDSTHVLGMLAQMSRLECVRETMRLALEFLERDSRLARPAAWPLWWERYVESKPDYKEKEMVFTEKLKQAGYDIKEMLAWAEQLEDRIKTDAAIELLRRVFAENFSSEADGTVEKLRAQPSGAVHNPHEPQAQWSAKDTSTPKEWIGYKAQIAETVEEPPRAKGEPTKSVITAIVTQEAIASDKAALPVVEQAWEDVGQEKPEKIYVDAGYTSAAELARAREEGRQVCGPVAPAPTKEGRHSSEEFTISIQQRTARCPAGKESTNCSRLENKETAEVAYRFEWKRKLCGSCDRKSQCLGKGQRHRTLVVGQHHELIQSRRQEQKTEAFKKEMHQRNAIEGTISELCRGYGLRKSRYRGKGKTSLQNHLIGAACNIKRWWRRVSWECREASKRLQVRSLRHCRCEMRGQRSVLLAASAVKEQIVVF